MVYKANLLDRYLNYNSNHPKYHKLNVIVVLVDHAMSLTSPEYYN